jgi:hypothetical protein
MHCKNIEIRPVKVFNPLKVPRKRQRLFIPKHSYHMLEITPIKKIIEASRSGHGGDFKVALNRCRGHFKTYTPDRPLMGKHVGRYFWAEHARGSIEHGEIQHDYKVNPTPRVAEKNRQDTSNG